jgi:hypothetical protein
MLPRGDIIKVARQGIILPMSNRVAERGRPVTLAVADWESAGGVWCTERGHDHVTALRSGAGGRGASGTGGGRRSRERKRAGANQVRCWCREGGGSGNPEVAYGAKAIVARPSIGSRPSFSNFRSTDAHFLQIRHFRAL